MAKPGSPRATSRVLVVLVLLVMVIVFVLLMVFAVVTLFLSMVVSAIPAIVMMVCLRRTDCQGKNDCKQ